MKIKPYADKLANSSAFREFKKRYSDAFMMAGFFIMDMETKQNLHQIDYYVPSEKKVAAFTIDGGVSVQMLNAMGAGKPEELDIKSKIDLDAIPGILQDEMKNRSITENIKKIIAILTMSEGKKIWNLNCILSGMGILKVHIDDDSQTILKMEKLSLMDIMKLMPAAQLARLKGAAGMPAGNEVNDESEESGQAGQSPAKESPELMEQKIKKLKQLEEAIKKEEEKTEQELEEIQKKAKKAKPKASKK
jgi:hypothetical protein